MKQKTRLSLIYTGCPKSRMVLRNYMEGRGITDINKAIKVLRKQVGANKA